MNKMKATADDNIIVVQMMQSFYDTIENIVGEKEKMLVTSIFSFSHNVFKRLRSFSRSWKPKIVWERVNLWSQWPFYFAIENQTK